MLKKSRLFFEERGVLEVDAPTLNSFCNIDDFIDPIPVTYCTNQLAFLHTSPELYLKKLLALKSGDVYFLGHVFRDHEKGSRHHVEFTMVEWYREKLNYQELIDETIEFVKLFKPIAQIEKWSYCDLFFKYTGIDYPTAKSKELISFIEKHLELQCDLEKESYSDLLNIIFSQLIEPKLDGDVLTVVTHFPKEQAALSKLAVVDDLQVALRFELYHQGLELANGYDELSGDHELKQRYEKLNEKRKMLGKAALPIDHDFIKANEKLPQCTGVAVGFDRLMMLRHPGVSLKELACFV